MQLLGTLRIGRTLSNAPAKSEVRPRREYISASKRCCELLEEPARGASYGTRRVDAAKRLVSPLKPQVARCVSGAIRKTPRGSLRVLAVRRSFEARFVESSLPSVRFCIALKASSSRSLADSTTAVISATSVSVFRFHVSNFISSINASWVCVAGGNSIMRRLLGRR